jgi:cytochrome c peroxidase
MINDKTRKSVMPLGRVFISPAGLGVALCGILILVLGSFYFPATRADSPGATILPADLPRPLWDSDFSSPEEIGAAKVQLGQLLFFDKVLSGNNNISCATCHHPLLQTGDGLSLSVGEGGRGLGVSRAAGERTTGIRQRVPRNSPPLFNLGAHEMRRLFHDGRVEIDASGELLTPVGDRLPDGLDNVLAAQAMFPVTSPDEMAGHGDENPVAQAISAERGGDPGAAWPVLAKRLQDIPEYVTRFQAAFDDVRRARDITFVHAANAIAAFEAVAFRADNTPFDRWLRGDAFALDQAEERGLWLFYGKAGCSHCHSGPLLTDQEFHAISIPQVGPGKGDGRAGLEDFGRARVTTRIQDLYRFRTPPLRNVALTGPWGHSGAYDTLEAVVRHHLDPTRALKAYDPDQLRLPARADLDAIDTLCHIELAKANELAPVELTEDEVADIVAFVGALTDPAVFDLRRLVPARVPSGLPVYD